MRFPIQIHSHIGCESCLWSWQPFWVPFLGVGHPMEKAQVSPFFGVGESFSIKGKPKSYFEMKISETNLISHCKFPQICQLGALPESWVLWWPSGSLYVGEKGSWLSGRFAYAIQKKKNGDNSKSPRVFSCLP